MRKGLAGRFLLLSLPVGLALLSQTGSTAREAGPRATAEVRPAPNRALELLALPGTEDLQLIIELTAPSVLEAMRKSVGQVSPGRPGGASQQSRLDLHSPQAQAHRARVAESQRQLSERLAGLPDVRIQAGIDTVMNALVVRMPVSEYADLRTLPGVKRIHFSRPYRMLLDTSAILVNAQTLWNRAGGKSQAGKGIKIGIIDTGIDTSNPMFNDDTLTAPAGYPKGEGEFTNGKVIVARNYMKLLPAQQAVNSALDEVGHGSFVAGAAAGKTVNAPLAAISGMAPGAFLGSYKVFGTPGINDFTTTAALLAAINDAVADGMDVLNLSLGSLNDVPISEDPEIGALENAISAGVVVVTAAGNEGPLAHTIENPGAAPNSITVGSVSNLRTFVSHLHVTAPAPVPANLEDLAYLPGDGPSIESPIPPTGIIDVASLDGSGQCCGPLPAGSLAGSIALVLRKPCSFAEKVGNAQAAGAAAVIVYNNNPAEGPVNMGGLGTTAIPAVMVSNADGVNLKQYIAANPGRVLVGIDDHRTLAARSTIPGILSSFSSVGPGTGLDVKPDLVAVGENVYSAAQSTNPKGAIYSPTGFILGQGTSFSSPMVAGAAACLKQLFPGLNAYDLKSIVTSSASPGVTVDGSVFASVLQSGSGMLNMGNASVAGAIVSPSSLNFGVRSYAGTISLTRTITVRNISGSADRYRFFVQPQDSGSRVTVDQDDAAVVPGATGSALFTIGVASPRSGGFQGMVTIESASSGAIYRIPYWAGFYVPDSSRILKVRQDSSEAGSFSSLPEALNAARPGNIIEIADSATYPGGITVQSNGEGLPLHGITIRAAAGQNPTLDGSSALFAPGDIRVMGLRNVLIQGIRITGGITGLLLSQSSTSVPLSVTIDHCIIDRTSGAGIVAFSGASVEVTGSTISNSSGTGIVTIGGTLALSDSSVRDNAADGIDALGVNVDIVRSSLTGNTGPGLNSIGSSGTIDGSTFSNNRGPSGDGLEIVNGTITIANSSFVSNERAGMAFLAGSSIGSGPSARVTGNTARANKAYGILAGAGQNLYLDGNLITDNGRGMRFAGFATATLTNNIVLRSSDIAAGNGIEALEQSRIRAVNNTIYGNTLHGIILDTTASAAVYNSIIAGNPGGDLLGMSSNTIQFSLIGDGSVSGNGNIAGAAKLNDPARDDVTPGADSPALDAGTNTAPDLPFTDYFHRLRMAASLAAITPARPANVDMGAIEASSSYPIVFPILANGNQPALGSSVVAGIALFNNGTLPARTEYSGYSASGLPLAVNVDPAARTIAPQGQISILGYQLLGMDPASSLTGSILANSSAPLNGFFLLFDSGFQKFATGLGTSGEPSNDLVFMWHQSDSSAKAIYALFNPGFNPANITAALYSPAGSIIGAGKTLSLAARAQVVFGFDDVSIGSGFVRCRSDRPISGFELMGNGQGLNALAPARPGSEARLFFPHIAVGGGFSTWIGIVNPTAIPGNIILTAYDDSGGILGVRTNVTLDSNSQLFESAADLFHLGREPLQTGYIVAQGDLGGLAGFTSFGYADASRRAGATLPSDSMPRQHMIFPHIAHQVPAAAGRTYQTGIALLNPFGTPVQYTMSVFDAAGSLVAQKRATLAARQKDSRFLSHPAAGAGFFSQPISIRGGHVDVTSEYGLLGLELFFTEDFSQLAAVPAQAPANVP